jgi:hypothetical protein
MLAKKRQLGEIVLAGKESARKRKLQREAKEGTIHKIANGIYSSGEVDNIPELVRKKWRTVVGHLVPGGILSHITAFLGMPTDENIITVSHPTKFNKTIELPGLSVILIRGPGQLPGDISLPDNGLIWASQARLLLENMGQSRKQITRAGPKRVEEKLIKILHVNGEKELNKIRDDAKTIAPMLNANQEMERLNGIIGALLGTHEKGQLRTKSGQMVAKGTPVDDGRIERFNLLANYLRTQTLPKLTDTALSIKAQQNFAFFESYFSNYVEGTKFSIEEAEDIVINNKLVVDRPKDSHDVLGVFKLATTPGSRDSVPPPGEAFIVGLSSRHREMMLNRPEANPGELKLEANYAGATQFVLPEMVRGTTQEASSIALTVPEGFPRSLFYEFMVSEIHPFRDGNGRISRIMMNAELSRMGLSRIIIPTLFHPQYVDSKKQLTQNNDPSGYVNALVRMAKWTIQFNYEDELKKLVISFQSCNAMEESPVNYRLLNLDGVSA